MTRDIAGCVLFLVANLCLSNSSNVLVICAVSYLLLYDIVCCLSAVSSNITCNMWLFVVIVVCISSINCSVSLHCEIIHDVIVSIPYHIHMHQSVMVSS